MTTRHRQELIDLFAQLPFSDSDDEALFAPTNFEIEAILNNMTGSVSASASAALKSLTNPYYQDIDLGTKTGYSIFTSVNTGTTVI